MSFQRSVSLESKCSLEKHSLPGDFAPWAWKTAWDLYWACPSPSMSALPYCACHNTSSEITENPPQANISSLSLWWQPQRNQPVGAGVRRLTAAAASLYNQWALVLLCLANNPVIPFCLFDAHSQGQISQFLLSLLSNKLFFATCCQRCFKRPIGAGKSENENYLTNTGKPPSPWCRGKDLQAVKRTSLWLIGYWPDPNQCQWKKKNGLLKRWDRVRKHISI